jgi:hypothetical protein
VADGGQPILAKRNTPKLGRPCNDLPGPRVTGAKIVALPSRSRPGSPRPSRSRRHCALVSEIAGDIRAFTPVCDGLCPAMTASSAVELAGEAATSSGQSDERFTRFGSLRMSGTLDKVQTRGEAPHPASPRKRGEEQNPRIATQQTRTPRLGSNRRSSSPSPRLRGEGRDEGSCHGLGRYQGGTPEAPRHQHPRRCNRTVVKLRYPSFGASIRTLSQVPVAFRCRRLLW